MNASLPEQVVKARFQLMLNQPFLATAVARLPVVNAEAMDWCKTMATDGYYIYVDPKFCETLNTEQISFVFAHELMHCVLGHIDRRGKRDRRVWNIAIDYATNALLVEAGLPMPPQGLYQRKYLGMTAEDIFEDLVKCVQPEQQQGGARGCGKEEPDEGSGDATAEGAGDLEGGVDGAQRVGDGTLAPSHDNGEDGFDLHVDPGDLEGQSLRAQEYPSATERRRLRVVLSDSVLSKLPGREAGYFHSEIEVGKNTRISWRELLSRFMTGLRRNDYRMFPFSKKHLWRGFYMPSIGVPGPDHLVVAIDTSGSMSDEVLSKVLGEIDALRATTECKLTVIQCDADIHAVQEFEPFESSHEVGSKGLRVFGRGGTDLRPPFHWVSKRMVRGSLQPDALIFMTDGYGPLPKQEPSFPVLFVVPENGLPQFPFGQVIRL